MEVLDGAVHAAISKVRTVWSHRQTIDSDLFMVLKLLLRSHCVRATVRLQPIGGYGIHECAIITADSVQLELIWAHRYLQPKTFHNLQLLADKASVYTY